MPYWLVDSSFAVMLLLLAATDAGLGALFFRLHHDPALLLGALGVPEGRQVIGAVALGYEADAATKGRLRPARRHAGPGARRTRSSTGGAGRARTAGAQGCPALTRPLKKIGSSSTFVPGSAAWITVSAP